MMLLDFLYHTLTTLLASLPSLLVIEPVSESWKVPGNYETYEPSAAPDTADISHTSESDPEPAQRNPKSLTIQITPPAPIHTAKMPPNIQIVQEVPSAKEAGVRNMDTGFPEPLSPDRNTTLAHPSADTSKNATLEAGDLELTKTHSRSRFLHVRHHSSRSVGSYGKIAPGEEGRLYEGIEYADGSREGAGVKDGSVANRGSGGERTKAAEKSEEVLQNEREEQPSPDGEKKKGLLRKLHLH